ncbi:type III secretion system cytoplasmic ring protein SctQ [Vibrio profundum]|uniref:type III secretion system cytoplasmic ring protein SctQ n=1 Tax=Vibrio profundum TaxID=2910247 RepID=UPI003D0C34E8
MENSQATSNGNLQSTTIQLAEYSRELLAAYQIVGHGLCSFSDSGSEIEISITPIKEKNSSWLSIGITLLGEKCTFYCLENQWLEYISEMLPIDKFANIPSELCGVLSSVSFAGLCAWAAEEELEVGDIGSIQAGDKEQWNHSEIRLTFTSPFCLDKKLSGFLCGFSNENLKIMARHMSPKQGPAEGVKLPIPCAVGLSVLTLGELKSLEVGDCVLLNWSSNFYEGEVLLVQNQPISSIRYQESGSFIVGQTMNEFDDLLDLSADDTFTGLNHEEKPVNLDQLMVTLVLEVGHVDLAISELATLHSGKILETELKAEPKVRLKANGKVIGLGSLLQVGDRLGVRVDQLSD